MPPTPLDKIKEQLTTVFQPVRDLIDRQKSASLMIAAGVVILLDVVLILMPLVQSVYKNTTRNSVLTKDINEVHGDKRDEDKLKTSLEKTRQKLEENESILALGDISLYLGTLSAMAQETGVHLSAVHPILPSTPKDDKSASNSKSESAYEATYFSISATAGYHALAGFVERMENSKTFIKVVRIQITGVKERSKEHDASITIKMIRKPAAG